MVAFPGWTRQINMANRCRQKGVVGDEERACAPPMHRKVVVLVLSATRICGRQGGGNQRIGTGRERFRRETSYSCVLELW